MEQEPKKPQYPEMVNEEVQLVLCDPPEDGWEQVPVIEGQRQLFICKLGWHNNPVDYEEPK